MFETAARMGLGAIVIIIAAMLATLPLIGKLFLAMSLTIISYLVGDSILAIMDGEEDDL